MVARIQRIHSIFIKSYNKVWMNCLKTLKNFPGNVEKIKQHFVSNRFTPLKVQIEIGAYNTSYTIN